VSAGESDWKIFNKVAILGTGLMGGSLGMALREKGLATEVIGYDEDRHSCEIAVEKGAIDNFAHSSQEAVERADLVILAVPVRLCCDIFWECLSSLKAGTVVSDLGSTKQFITTEVSPYLPSGVTFIGGHPMTGSDESGIGAADPTLLENAIYVLTPQPGDPQPVVDSLQKMVRGIGAQPLLLSPAEHDRVVALVSHLPHLAAIALVTTAANEGDEEMVKTLAAGGFRDTTRIAMGDPEVWQDIFVTNPKAIDQFLTSYQKELEELRLIINEGKESDLKERLRQAQSYRKNIPHRSRGIFPEIFDLVVLVKDTPGVIGKIATLLGERSLNIAEVEILHVREESGGSIRFGFREEKERDRAIDVLKQEGYRAHRR